MRVMVLLLALASSSVLAVGNAVVAPQTAANLQSTIRNLGSADAITVPQMFSYQGRLTDTLGQPVPNGNYQLHFRLYVVPSGGAPFWSETQTVAVQAGLFHALLGAASPILALPDSGAVYLGMQVASGSELSPRLRIASAAYAYLAADAGNSNRLQGKDTSGFVRTGQAGSVTSAMIADGAISAADLGQMGATTGQVMKWDGSAWLAANDSLGTADNAWVRVGSDSVLYTAHQLGIARGGAGNALFGESTYTHVNLGVACTTGSSGQAYRWATIGGGQINVASSNWSTVGGGCFNNANGDGATVAGGAYNVAESVYAVVAGGSDDTASAMWSAVVGGNRNVAGGRYSFVGGGTGNEANGQYAFLGGGYWNGAHSQSATVGGGSYNGAGDLYSSVLGGYSNHANGTFSTVGGGNNNYATDTFASVVGGSQNTASGFCSAVGGGLADTARAIYGGVLSGYSNLAGDATDDTAAVVCGGLSNSALGPFTSVGGGNQNVASNWQSVVGGGRANTASGGMATVAGGANNNASGAWSTIGGGYWNEAGNYATVPGGYYCSAMGSNSLAAGSYALASGAGSFVWSDSCGPADSVVTTTANRWVARARGGVYFYTNLGMTTGSYLASGGSSWNSVSDSMTKENFRQVDKKALLETLARMRVRDYNLKSQDPSIRHIGPVAQDFHSAFGFGESNTAINMEDADGVAIAAIQALYEDNKALRSELEALKAELAARK